jgi:hypothetical protein
MQLLSIHLSHTGPNLKEQVITELANPTITFKKKKKKKRNQSTNNQFNQNLIPKQINKIHSHFSCI